MNDFDASKVTAVIAVAAIVSPILTAVINNIFHLIIKAMDNKEKKNMKTTEYKRSVIEDYLLNVGPYLTTDSQVYKEKYRASYALALMYVPSKIKNKMIEIDNLPFENRTLAKAKLEQLIPELEELLGEL